MTCIISHYSVICAEAAFPVSRAHTLADPKALTVNFPDVKSRSYSGHESSLCKQPRHLSQYCVWTFWHTRLFFLFVQSAIGREGPTASCAAWAPIASTLWTVWTVWVDIFGGFFGFDPFMNINQSGVCGCSRVLQTRWLGISMVSTQMRFKLEKEAENPSADQEPFGILHSCVKAIDSLTGGSEDFLGYEPIIFR